MLGQVFTPPGVARWMTAWACSDRPRRILEPAVGEGVFLDAVEALAADQSAWQPTVHGHEVDARLREHIRNSSRCIDVRLSSQDFVRSDAARRYDACVANPPYIRHHALDYDESVYRRFDRLVGERISRMTNLYGLFLLRIWERLANCGRAAIIMPSEWLNADFGRPLKRFFLRENAIDGIVLFDDDALVFDGVLTTAAILLLRRGRSDDDVLRAEFVRDAETLTHRRFETMRPLRHHVLSPEGKWTNILADFCADRPVESASATLADVATCTRGIATGANQYFTLTEQERLAAGIDRRDVKPCITKAGHTSGPVFDRTHWDVLAGAGKKVWILNPRDPIRDPLARYLERGRMLRIHERYLPSHRPVWYRPEQRAPAPIWSPVFVRGRFRFTHNAAGALNLTAFHGVFLKFRAPGAIDALLEYLWSDAAQRGIGAQSRLYGGGLRKLEPRDVLAIPIPISLKNAICDY